MEDLLILKSVHGSHLYKTNTPTSDKDFYGIYLPSIEAMLLNHGKHFHDESIKKSETLKNDSDDIDYKLISVQKFCHMAKQGETIAIDLLCSSKEDWIHYDPQIWEFIYNNRNKFLTKSLISFLTYSKRQASKYGIKGSRISICKLILDLFRKYETYRIVEIPFDEINTIYHTALKYLEPITVTINKDNNGEIIPSTSYFTFAARDFLFSVKAKSYISTLEDMLKKYGNRSKMAEENLGIDWKAIHHAFRFTYLVHHSVINGSFITFPLPETKFLIDIKQGNLLFKEIQPVLDNLILETKTLLTNSSLPDVCDPKWFEDEIIYWYKSYWRC